MAIAKHFVVKIPAEARSVPKPNFDYAPVSPHAARSNSAHDLGARRVLVGALVLGGCRMSVGGGALRRASCMLR